MVRRIVIASAFGAVAFLAAGPLQHIGAVPQTWMGDASKTVIKHALNMSASDAWACGRGRGPRGNNGFGNGGFDGVPGGSSHQDVTR